MANRKLQTEIDRVLKKVSEGVETFEGIFEKIQATNNANQKEKLEQDLKKEIKKLQRHRDQIKTWISSNDIKDKRALLENRRLIEQQMEKFKACEKEMKTKAYSKEGLSQLTKMDPKEKEKMDTCDWVSQMVDSLAIQIEAAEAEIEILQAVVKKGRKDTQKLDRLTEVEQSVERHKWHTNRLELILRLLENGNIPAEKVIQIQEDIKYYVETNQEPDFAEDENIYDDLNLEEEEELYGIANEDHHSSHDSVTDEPRTPQKEHSSPVTSPTARIILPKPPQSVPPARKVSISNAYESTPPRIKEEEKPKISNPTPGTISQSPPPTSAYPLLNSGGIRTLAAVARASIPDSNTLTASNDSLLRKYSGVQPSSSLPEQNSYLANSSTSLSPAASITASQVNPNKDVTNEEIETLEQQSPQNADTEQTQKASPETVNIPSSPNHQSPPQQALQMRDPAPVAPLVSTQTSSVKSISLPNNNNEPVKQNHLSIQENIPQQENRFPAALSDLVASFEAAKEKSLAKIDGYHTQQMLDTSLEYVPESLDYERTKYYAPRNPYPTSQYYPQTPLGIFDNPALFEKFDIDTLFFIFYYQQGTYQQYLAARELKKQSWRFHKKYLTWFQRHEEPKAITDEYEQGTYIYFDYEGAWCQRKKTEFRFEYRFLEDAELI
ncbi:hypothetical protein G9A89_012827 [Geosiphon pyriformis]|nr:hypothetical protein G9A89_012827 [Geosiphon pyriformis]